jgi:hypothetical protein
MKFFFTNLIRVRFYIYDNRVLPAKFQLSRFAHILLMCSLGGELATSWSILLEISFGALAVFQ